MPRGAVPTARAIRHGRLHLLDQLAAVEPDVVVLMALPRPEPFSITTSRYSKSMATSPCALAIARYFITVHPSAAVRFPAMRKLFLRDLQRLPGILRNGKREAEQHPRSCNLDNYQQEVACPAG